MKKDPWSKRKNLYSSPVPKAVSKPKVKWRAFPILWLALKRTCMFLGASILISSIIMAFTIASVVKDMNVELPDKMVLYMELDGELGDLPQDMSIVDPFSNHTKTLKGVIDAINTAKTDPRVMGIYARVKSGRYQLTHIQELRAAIKDFRTSGKFAYIYASSYGNGLGGYYLATSFDKIWMQPMGSVMITGINAQMPFLRNVLDKIGIEPQFFQRKEYKNAYDSLTNSEMSGENREAMDALISGIAGVLNSDISADRGFDKGEFKKLVDSGLFISNEALKTGLIDVVDYADILVEHINMKVTGNIKGDGLIYINFDSYMNKTTIQNDGLFNISEEEKTAPRIALVYAVGAIMDDDGSSAHALASLGGSPVAAADKIAGALIAAAYDDDIDGVVLRVDSPGGSPVASETILRAVQKLQEKGKSVTVSMGSMAASGGYWISAYADQIFVLPTTITGSIGVLGGKFSAQQLWKNLGVNWDGSKWGANSAMFSANTPFSKDEAERMNIMLDNIYDSFITRVSKGRDMSIDQVEEIARGRVWLGTHAVKNGLADQFGGLNDALDYAAVKAGARGRSDIDILIMPKPLTPIEKFMELLESQVTAGKIMGIQAKILESLSPIISDFLVAQDSNNSVYAPVEIR